MWSGAELVICTTRVPCITSTGGTHLCYVKSRYAANFEVFPDEPSPGYPGCKFPQHQWRCSRIYQSFAESELFSCRCWTLESLSLSASLFLGTPVNVARMGGPGKINPHVDPCLMIYIPAVIIVFAERKNIFPLMVPRGHQEEESALVGSMF